MEIYHNLLCHNQAEFSFTKLLFVPTLECNDK
jgi:hypothetical protein